MASKFKGRDYSTLRSEIIEFLRQRLNKDWDYTNLADPVVIFAESLARVGDQLHFTIDELRRECDVATAKRASSIYSYAMREGYKMFLPRAPFGTISVNTIQEQDGMLHLRLSKFDEIKVKPLGFTLYVANDNTNNGVAIDADLHAPINKEYANSLANYYDSSGNIINDKRSVYQAYVEDVYNKTQHIRVVLGEKREFSFTYNDINADSTVEIPDVMIDRNLVRLSYMSSKTNNDYIELAYVDDVISSGFNYYSFTLTPKFIGGAITLCIEFPTNYKDIFKRDLTTKFKFEYILAKNIKIDPLPEYQDNAEAVDFGAAIYVVSGHESDPSIEENGPQYRVDFGNGIKGYTEYENAAVTRENYKRFVQSYAALLTKDDYTNYIRASTTSNCRIYDHGDNYKSPPVLPEGTNLLQRVIYAITDSVYSEREVLWYDLKERSSRSDCIVLMPFGKDPYLIVIDAECNLVGTSAASVTMQIEKELLNYYANSVGEKIPKISMINYLVHKASDKVVQMRSSIVRDSTYGSIDTTFNNVTQLSNSELDILYDSFTNGQDINYISPLTDDTQLNTDYKYSFRGKLYIDSNNKVYTKAELDAANSERYTPIQVTELFYNKYPTITKIESEGVTVIDEYPNFPDKFPSIYVKKNNSWEVCAKYDILIEHQTVYGEVDSPDWDIKDTEIFTPERFIQSDNDGYMNPSWIYCSYNEDDTDYYGYISSDSVSLYVKNNSESDWIQSDFLFVKYQDGSTEKNSKVLIKGTPNPEESLDSPKYKYATTTSTYLYSQPDIRSDKVKNLSDEIINISSGATLSESTGEVSAVYYTDVSIDSDYIKHHYMVPVLSKVIILIKSISSN